MEGGIAGGIAGGVIGGVVGGVPNGSPPTNLPDIKDGILSMGDPRLVQTRCPRIVPQYPQKARDAHVEATVLARCVVEKTGALDCKMLKSHPLFDKEILDTLAKTKVSPFTTTDGTPVRVSCMYPFRFRME